MIRPRAAPVLTRLPLVLAIALALAAPLSAAAPAETVRVCSSSGCVIAQDTDGDGRYDWANGALILGEQAALNVNVNRTQNGTRVLWQADATTEELGGHEVEEVLAGLGAEPGAPTLAAFGEADVPRGERGPRFGFADALLVLSLGDHETGEQDTLLFQYVGVRDSDGDGIPETLEGVALP